MMNAGQNEGDVMMFNNRQSISSTSMLSNRLMTPVQNKNQLFQYHSQLVGNKVDGDLTEKQLGDSQIHDDNSNMLESVHHEEEKKSDRTPSKSENST